MATRKKSKAKAKPKRRKVAAKRPASRKSKIARKPLTPPRPPRIGPRKAAARPKRAAKQVAAERPAPGERVGVVTHYYGNLQVAIIKLESGSLRVGDMIHIRGHTSDFSQRVDSLQVEHQSVPQVGPNDDFGLKVAAHAREHDVVYKLK